MAHFYITRLSTNEIYALDSTKNIRFCASGDASDSPVESGDSVQDNYVNKNDVVSFRGVVSSIKSLGNAANKSPDDYVNGLLAIKRNRELFSVQWHPGFKLDNCVFTSLEIEQDRDHGYNEATGIKSFEVCFTAKQIRFVSRARITTAPAAGFVDAFQDKATGTASTFDMEGGELSRADLIIADLKEKDLLKKAAQQ